MTMRPPDRWAGLRRVFRLPRNRSRMRDELDEEMRLHVEGRIEDLVVQEGLSRVEAEGEARRRFGDPCAYARETRAYDNRIRRRLRRWERLDGARTELAHAIRTLRRSPGFSVVALVTLALGLGAATTIFTLLDRIVLRPLPYPTAGRLVHIGSLWPRVKAGEEYGISVGQFFYFREHSKSLTELGVYQPTSMLAPGDGPIRPSERVDGVLASASLFRVLGIRPELGRLFTPQESRPAEPSVVVLSHEYWLRRYGADPHVLGHHIALEDGTGTVEIIGVLPAGATAPQLKADLWRPMHLDPSEQPENNHTRWAVGLARPEVTTATIAADLERLQTQFASLYPGIYSRAFLETSGFRLHVASLRDTIVGSDVSRTLWTLFASVGLVLLIAGGNVANLFLVRIDARRREVALRTALGASRAHLAIHYTTESMTLALGAGLVAIVFAHGLLHATLALAPQTLPRLGEVHLDWSSAAFCIVCSIGAGLAFGCLPMAGPLLNPALLGDGGRGRTTSRPRTATRRGLVVTQVAFAVVLLAASGLMVKSFAQLRGVQPGFDPTGVQSMDLLLPPPRYPNEMQVFTFWHELSDRIAALPGVQRVGAVSQVPLNDQNGCASVVLDDPTPGAERSPCVAWIDVTPGYFATMGIPVTGREPTWQDVQSRGGALVVSRAFANRFWPGQDPVGHTIRLYNEAAPPSPVVGVAADVRANGLRQPPIEAVYTPIVRTAGEPEGSAGYFMSIVVRSSAAKGDIAGIRRVVADLDPHVSIANVEPMASVVARSMADTSFIMLLLAIAATIALVLSVVGIYGVVSYVVAQRRAEIGIRMALGAQVSRVGRMVVSESLVLAAVGALGGVAAAAAGTRLLRSLLFEVSPLDPVVFVAAPVAVLVLASAATLAPARRAARVDPSEAIRAG